MTEPVDTAAHVAAVRRDAIKGKRRLAASVLGMEVVVFWLALIVAVVVSRVSAAVAVPIGVGLALCCVLVAASIRRPWAYPAGWVLQLLAVASGFVVHTMFVVGAIFLLLWLAALRVGDAAIRVANNYAARVGQSGAPAGPPSASDLPNTS